MLVVETTLRSTAGETLAAGLLSITSTCDERVSHGPRDIPSLVLEAHILRRLHSAHACGVVILLAVPLFVDFGFSCCSAAGFLGVTPWKV